MPLILQVEENVTLGQSSSGLCLKGKPQAEGLLPEHRACLGFLHLKPKGSVLVVSLMQIECSEALLVLMTVPAMSGSSGTCVIACHPVRHVQGATFGFFHDMLVTDNYYIAVENPISMNFGKLLTAYTLGRACLAECLQFEQRPTRIHLIPRPGTPASGAAPQPTLHNQLFTIRLCTWRAAAKRSHAGFKGHGVSRQKSLGVSR